MNSGRIAVIVGVMCGLTFLSGLDNPVTWMLPLVIVVPFIAYPRLSKIYWLLIAFSALLVMYPFAAAWELCSLAQNAFNQTAVAHVLTETRSALLVSIFIIAFILAFYYAWIARQIADVEANRLRVFISLEQSQMSRRTLGIGYGLLLILAALAVCVLIQPYFVLSSDFQGKLGWQNLLLDLQMGLTLIGGFILPWLALLIADIRRSVENEASSSKSR